MLHNYKLVVTITKRGLGSQLVALAKEIGAGGGTILYAKGSISKETSESIFGIKFEPEKEIVIIAIDDKLKDKLLALLATKIDFNKPGGGIAFVLNIQALAGISRLLNKNIKEDIND